MVVLPLVLAVLMAPSASAAAGGSLPLDRHRGEIVVLNFWATWCEPCRKEIPLLVRLQREYGRRGVRIVGASIDEPEDRDVAERFVRDRGVNYPVWYGHTAEDMKPLGLATAIPATAIFDREGTRVFRIVGEIHEDAIRPRLDWLLGARPTAAPAELVLPPGVTPEHFAQHEAGVEEDDHDHHAEVAQGDEGGSAVPT
jgi:thiol-disulfide isomerase/thioredoxin